MCGPGQLFLPVWPRDGKGRTARPGCVRSGLPDAEAPGEACGSTQLRKWVGAPGFLDREVAEGSGSFYT